MHTLKHSQKTIDSTHMETQCSSLQLRQIEEGSNDLSFVSSIFRNPLQRPKARKSADRAHEAWTRDGTHSRLYAGGNSWNSESDNTWATQRNRERHLSWQHLPPLPAPGNGGHRKARRASQLHGVARAHTHRLRRLSSLLAIRSPENR